jgi:hypothetical protein
LVQVLCNLQVIFIVLCKVEHGRCMTELIIAIAGSKGTACVCLVCNIFIYENLEGCVITMYSFV